VNENLKNCIKELERYYGMDGQENNIVKGDYWYKQYVKYNYDEEIFEQAESILNEKLR
jgi:hypothetical protein